MAMAWSSWSGFNWTAFLAAQQFLWFLSITLAIYMVSIGRYVVASYENQSSTYSATDTDTTMDKPILLS